MPRLPNDPIRSVVDDIRRIVRALRISSRSCEKACGLGAAQLFVLRQLEQSRQSSQSHSSESERAISVNELAARTLTHQSTVSVVVRKLVEQKLVSRRMSAEDSRKVELSLTALGRRRLSDAPKPVQENLVAALRRMTAADRRELARLLSLLVDEAGYDLGEAPMLFADEARARSNSEGVLR